MFYIDIFDGVIGDVIDCSRVRDILLKVIIIYFRVANV